MAPSKHWLTASFLLAPFIFSSAAPAEAKSNPVNAAALPWNELRRDNVINLDLRASGQLVQCESVTLDWASDKIPKGRPYTYNVEAVAHYVDVDENGETEHKQVGRQYFATPATSLSWLVDFPAGTIIQFHLNVWTRTNPIIGESLNFTIAEGTTADCVPAAHYPMLLKTPTTFAQCEVAEFTWTGGQGPYSVFIEPVFDDENVFYAVPIADIVTLEENATSYTWRTDYPVGSELRISFWGDMGASSVSERFNVSGVGLTNSCIPRSHYPPGKRWFQKPFAIVAFVFGGLWAVALLGFGAVQAYRAWQRRQGVIHLEEDEAI